MSEAPAPWDLPPKAARPPRSERRGPSKVKPLSDAARRAIAEKRPARAEMAIIDCPGCGFLVLHGQPEGWGPTTLDVWQVPYDDAVIIDRYHLGPDVVLWREYGRGKVDGWAPWNKQAALIRHRCGNRWWLYRPSIYVEAVNARHRN